MPSPRNRPADTPDTRQHSLLPSQGPMQFDNLSGPVGGAMKVDKRVLPTTVTGIFATTSVSADEDDLPRPSHATEIFDKKVRDQSGWSARLRPWARTVPHEGYFVPSSPRSRNRPETVLKPKIPILTVPNCATTSLLVRLKRKVDDPTRDELPMVYKEASLEMYCTPRGVLCTLQPLQLRPPEA